MVSDDGYRVNFTVMAEQVDQLAVAGQTLEADIDDLRSQLSGTLGPDHWDNGARDAWNAVQHQWDVRTRDMHAKIAQAQRLLTDIYEHYHVTENQATQMWDNSGLSMNKTGIAANGYHH